MSNLELEKPKKKFLGVKTILSVVGVIILLGLSYTVGSTSAETEINGERVKYDSLVKKVSNLENERDKINKDIGTAEEQLKTKEKEYDEAMKVISSKEEAQKSLGSINGEIGTKKTEIDSLNKEIEVKKAELAMVTGQIIEKKEEPKTLTAGFFTVGKDIPAGRYKVVPNNGNGNFFVNGGMSVNIMLGRGEFYQQEYVFTANEGDTIELTLSAKFIPVQ